MWQERIWRVVQEFSQPTVETGEFSQKSNHPGLTHPPAKTFQTWDVWLKDKSALHRGPQKSWVLELETAKGFMNTNQLYWGKTAYGFYHQPWSGTPTLHGRSLYHSMNCFSLLFLSASFICCGFFWFFFFPLATGKFVISWQEHFPGKGVTKVWSPWSPQETKNQDLSLPCGALTTTALPSQLWSFFMMILMVPLCVFHQGQAPQRLKTPKFINPKGRPICTRALGNYFEFHGVSLRKWEVNA